MDCINKSERGGEFHFLVVRKLDIVESACQVSPMILCLKDNYYKRLRIKTKKMLLKVKYRTY